MKILALCSLIVLASCAGRKNAGLPKPAEEIIAMAGMVRSAATPAFTDKKETDLMQEPEVAKQTGTAGAALQMNDGDEHLPLSKTAITTTKKAKSFSQMKEMVANGGIAMSKKDLKLLTKLDQLSKEQQNNQRSDPFEMTLIAKIIAGVGIASLLIALISGSWFFLFLFIVAVLAFLCRWIGIIEF